MRSCARYLLVGLLGGALAAQGLALSAESWSSKELGLRLRAPTGWTVLSPGPTEALLTPPFGKAKIAIFGLPLSDAARSNPDLQQIADDAIASLKESFKKFKLLSRRDVDLAGHPAQEIYFSGRIDGTKFRFVQTLLPYGDHQIVLMYMSPDEMYSRFLADYDQTVLSVRWLPRS